MFFPINKEWNLFDLKKDPHELKSVHSEPAYAKKLDDLKKEFYRLRKYFDAPDFSE
jgi:N-acetylglucosamine-6-sulfatase